MDAQCDTQLRSCTAQRTHTSLQVDAHFPPITTLTSTATSITCTTNLGPNPAAGAVAFTIASFAADGTTVKDASIALGTYTTYAYPTGIVKQEWTDNTYVHISGATSASTYYHTPPHLRFHL